MLLARLRSPRAAGTCAFRTGVYATVLHRRYTMTCTICCAALWAYEAAQGIRTCRQCRKPKSKPSKRSVAKMQDDAIDAMVRKASIDAKGTASKVHAQEEA